MVSTRYKKFSCGRFENRRDILKKMLKKKLILCGINDDDRVQDLETG